MDEGGYLEVYFSDLRLLLLSPGIGPFAHAVEVWRRKRRKGSKVYGF